VNFVTPWVKVCVDGRCIEAWLQKLDVGLLLAAECLGVRFSDGQWYNGKLVEVVVFQPPVNGWFDRRQMLALELNKFSFAVAFTSVDGVNRRTNVCVVGLGVEFPVDTTWGVVVVPGEGCGCELQPGQLLVDSLSALARLMLLLKAEQSEKGLYP